MSRSRPLERGSGKPLLAIEHLEDHVSRWLWAEYKHASMLAGERLVFTNGRCFCRRLNRLAKCYEESIVELAGKLYTSPSKVIVLDPLAPETLEPEEARQADVIVVGGILGDHPPRGRTRRLLTSRMRGALARNIGEGQFSIDGAVYVALRVLEGARVRDIEVVRGLSVRAEAAGLEFEVELPYAYPVENGRPVVAPELPELIARGLAYEEYKLAAEDESDEECG